MHDYVRSDLASKRAKLVDSPSPAKTILDRARAGSGRAWYAIKQIECTLPPAIRPMKRSARVRYLCGRQSLGNLTGLPRNTDLLGRQSQSILIDLRIYNRDQSVRVLPKGNDSVSFSGEMRTSGSITPATVDAAASLRRG